MVIDWEKEKILTNSRFARVFAPTNIALAKYWGKRDINLNLPQTSSLSATLEGLGTFTTVEFNETFKDDSIYLDGSIQTQPSFLKKAKIVLDLVRKSQNVNLHARVQTSNNFPTAAGLASSASGLAALTLASAQALKCDLTHEQLSAIARQGSGSASRSLLGGFVRWSRGVQADGTDSYATQIQPSQHWSLKVLVCVVNERSKGRPSTDGMELTRKTSPYFSSWVDFAEKSVDEIALAIKEKNFTNLTQLAEENCLRMHASAQAAEPPVLYWEPTTIALMKKVWELRESRFKVFFTIDAGPNVVVFCDDSRGEEIKSALLSISDVQILESGIGEGARVIG